jgi:hypothetical protein
LPEESKEILDYEGMYLIFKTKLIIVEAKWSKTANPVRGEEARKSSLWKMREL